MALHQVNVPQRESDINLSLRVSFNAPFLFACPSSTRDLFNRIACLPDDVSLVESTPIELSFCVASDNASGVEYNSRGFELSGHSVKRGRQVFKG